MSNVKIDISQFLDEKDKKIIENKTQRNAKIMQEQVKNKERDLLRGNKVNDIDDTEDIEIYIDIFEKAKDKTEEEFKILEQLKTKLNKDSSDDKTEDFLDNEVKPIESKADNKEDDIVEEIKRTYRKNTTKRTYKLTTKQLQQLYNLKAVFLDKDLSALASLSINNYFDKIKDSDEYREEQRKFFTEYEEEETIRRTLSLTDIEIQQLTRMKSLFIKTTLSSILGKAIEELYRENESNLDLI